MIIEFDHLVFARSCLPAFIYYIFNSQNKSIRLNSKSILILLTKKQGHRVVNNLLKVA